MEGFFEGAGFGVEEGTGLGVACGCGQFWNVKDMALRGCTMEHQDLQLPRGVFGSSDAIRLG